MKKTMVEQQMKMILKGAEELVGKESIVKKLKQDQRITIKLGLDPTAPDLHLGHTVVLRKIRQFQDLGHNAIIIIGDFTGRIGDPTGKDKTRKQLSDVDVKKNAETYTKQLFKVLDQSKTEIHYNSHWLSKLNFEDVVHMCSKHTVARMMEREGFKSRFNDNKPVFIHEFFYPLMQGYDSVELKPDIELGGTEQRFNVLMGRTMMTQEGLEPQAALFMPVLEGTDGKEKMSKSLGNYIGIDESPEIMYQKVMRIPDDLIIKYFQLCTDVHPDDIAIHQQDLENNKVNPRDIKMVLAHEITSLYHGTNQADIAEKQFIHVFHKGKMPENVLEVPLEKDKSLLDLLMNAHLISSKSEGRRLIAQGGVKINGKKIDSDQVLLRHGDTIKIGKQKFCKLTRESVLD